MGRLPPVLDLPVHLDLNQVIDELRQACGSPEFEPKVKKLAAMPKPMVRPTTTAQARYWAAFVFPGDGR